MWTVHCVNNMVVFRYFSFSNHHEKWPSSKTTIINSNPSYLNCTQWVAKECWVANLFMWYANFYRNCTTAFWLLAIFSNKLSTFYSVMNVLINLLGISRRACLTLKEMYESLINILYWFFVPNVQKNIHAIPEDPNIFHWNSIYVKVYYY